MVKSAIWVKGGHFCHYSFNNLQSFSIVTLCVRSNRGPADYRQMTQSHCYCHILYTALAKTDSVPPFLLAELHGLCLVAFFIAPALSTLEPVKR
jgi:hypothetical protein